MQPATSALREASGESSPGLEWRLSDYQEKMGATMSFRRAVQICSLLLFFVSIVASKPVVGQQVDVKSDPRFDALTWVQNSAEYELLARQTFRMALSQLYVGCRDCQWSADEVQLADGGFVTKPPAVILDVDETVLDNSAYNARNIINGTQYTTDDWNQWCQECQAGSIPGALEFVQAAQGLGIKIFYITNRRDEVKAATLRNLADLGFPVDEATLLTKNPEDGRGDDKISRRAMVARDYRIVLLVGDSMSDLCSGMDVPNTKRRNEIAAEKTRMLGSRWIMMPNPVYGSWQRALPEGKKALQTKME